MILSSGVWSPGGSNYRRVVPPAPESVLRVSGAGMSDLSRAHGPGQVVSDHRHAMDVCDQPFRMRGRCRRIHGAVECDRAVVGFNMNAVLLGQMTSQQRGLDLGAQRRVANLVLSGVICVLYQIAGGARGGLHRGAALMHFLTRGAVLRVQGQKISGNLPSGATQMLRKATLWREDAQGGRLGAGALSDGPTLKVL